MQRFANVLKPFWLKTMPRIGNNDIAELVTFAHIGFNLRRIGKNDMQEFLRVISLPARDLMDEYFDSDLLKATLSWDGLIGSKLAPRSPNSAVLAMLYRIAGESGGAHEIPQGGVNGLMKALCASATESGVEVRCAAKVSRIVIESNTEGHIATGVQLADGEEIGDERIISATDPERSCRDLVGVAHVDIDFT